jgi:anti-sigma factor RsiW
MTCDEVSRTLANLDPGDFATGFPATVLDHCTACPKCRDALAALDPVAASLAGEPVPAVPAGFRSRLMEKARSMTPEADWSRERRAPAWGLRLAVAASILLGITIGLATGLFLARPAMESKGRGTSDPMDLYCLTSPGSARDVSLHASYLDLVSQLGAEAR